MHVQFGPQIFVVSSSIEEFLCKFLAKLKVIPTASPLPLVIRKFGFPESVTCASLQQPQCACPGKTVRQTCWRQGVHERCFLKTWKKKKDSKFQSWCIKICLNWEKLWIRPSKIPIFRGRTSDRELIVCAILPVGLRPVTGGGGLSQITILTICTKEPG